jgi:hypothetical protein
VQPKIGESLVMPMPPPAIAIAMTIGPVVPPSVGPPAPPEAMLKPGNAPPQPLKLVKEPA